MIPPNDFHRQWAATSDDVLRAVTRVGESGWYILGREVEEFERALAEYWGVPHAVGVASGLDAIELSLRAIGCGPGDPVLTSPVSAFATVLAILKIGAQPVFVDCDAGGLIDLEACRELLRTRPDIRCFVPVHLYGHALDSRALRALRDEFDLHIVEDCAQSIDARSHGEPAGCIGRFAATSFYPTKNLGALGDGGAVLVHTDADAEAIRRLRDYGQSSKYRHDVIGYNSRLDEVQAAILRSAFLPRLPEWTEARGRIASAYLAGISSPALRIPPPPRASESCWHLFPILVEPGRKAEAIAYFRAHGIGVGEHYPLALIEQDAMAAFREDAGSASPAAIDFCRREISLPIHPFLTEAEVEQVIQACNGWR